MRFTARLRTFEINRSAYLSAVNSHFTALIQDAAHQWLRTVLFKIPVWSGASAATFTELAAAVAFPLGIVPDGNAPNRIPLGTQHGQGVIVTEPGKRFTFQYETDLHYLIYNEFHNANLVGFKLKRPGPYQFQKLGQAAFEQFAKRAQMPDPFNQLKIKQVTV